MGKCPLCGSDVYEYEKGFFCENYKECRYGIWNEDQCFKKFKKKPNKTMVKSLLKKGEAKVKSFTDANGNKFDAKKVNLILIKAQVLKKLVQAQLKQLLQNQKLMILEKNKV